MFFLKVLAIIGIVACVVFGVDMCSAFLTWSSRIKIGRYSSVSEWIQKSEKVVKKWVKKAPTVKLTDNNRYLLLDMIKGKYRNNTIQSWQQAGLLFGMDDEEILTEMVSTNIDLSIGQWREVPKEIDYALLAYQILKYYPNTEVIKLAMDTMIELINTRKEENYIWYRNYAKNNLYVDTVGLVSPFLVLYGKKYQKEECVKLGLGQIRIYAEKGMLNDVMIPCHAYDLKNEVPLGTYGWGRGFGWFLLGVIEVYLQLDIIERPEWLITLTVQLADTVLKFQHEDGGFGSILALESSYDSSVTAIAGYYLVQCARVFECEKYFKAAKKCMKKLMSVTRRNGVLDLCQGDTKGIGIYSTVYDVMPFAQGIALELAKMIEGELNEGEF